MRGYALKLGIALWLSLILFSSTSTAGEWSETSFRWIASTFLKRLREGQPAYDNVSFAAEKSFHLLMFTVFAMLIWRMIPEVPWKFGMVMAIGLTLGIASELLQSRFPGRDPTVRDVLINITGTALGAAISSSLMRRRVNSQTRP